MALKKIKLKTRLWLNLFVLVLVFGLAIGVFQFALSSADQGFGKAIDDELAMGFHAQNIQFLMLQCRRAEKDFLLRKDEKYLGILEGHVNSLKSEAQAFRAIALRAGYEEDRQHADEIIQLADNYFKSFIEVFNSNVKKGLDPKSGLQGRFRQAVQRVQGRMPEYAIDDLSESYLYMRRYEKDYHRTRSEKNKKKWKKATADYQSALDNSRVDEVAKKTQRQGFDKYANAAENFIRTGAEKYFRTLRSEAHVIESAIESVHVRNAGTLALNIRKNEKDYLLRGDEKYVLATRKAVESLSNAFKNSGILEEHVLEIQKDLEAYMNDFDNLVAENKNILGQIGRMRNAVHEIEGKVRPLVVGAEEKAGEIIISTENRTRSMNVWAIIIGIAAIIIGSLMVALNIRTILRQLGGDPFEIAEIAKKLASGQFDIEQSKQNTTGVYAELTEMTNSLKGAIMSIQKTMDSISKGDFTSYIDNENMTGDLSLIKGSINSSIDMLSSTIFKVVAVAEQVNAGAGQISISSQALATGTTEQAASLEEISSSMSEVEGSAKANSENANQTLQLSNQALAVVSRGNSQMKDMLASMDKINDTSSDISKIIKVIDEIASQTNLLALNAAVEAARAGKYGKGFAVVAEEVRSLASRSAEAAKNTTELIENSAMEVENGVSNAGKTAEILNEINESISKVNDLVGEISTASHEQSASTEEMSKGLTQVNNVVQQNSSVSEETASASEELSSQSLQLQELMSRFHLKQRETNQDTPSVPPASIPPKVQVEGVVESPKMIALDDDDFGKY